MKKLFVLTLLSSLTFANNLDTLLGRVGMSAGQAHNFKQGMSSIFSGTRNNYANSDQPSYSLGDCIELVEKEKEKQLENDSKPLKIGYALGSFGSRLLEGEYTEFYEAESRENYFGNNIKRGLPIRSRVRFNSTSHAPQTIYQCNQYMDIEKVEAVNFDGKECRKITMEIKGREQGTENLIKHNFSNYYCVNESTVVVDYLGHESELISTIDRAQIEYDEPEYDDVCID